MRRRRYITAAKAEQLRKEFAERCRVILDQFGRPVNLRFHPDAFALVLRELADAPRVDWEAERRISELRNSIAFAEHLESLPLVSRGDAITVRLPTRYAVEPRDHVEGDVRMPWGTDDPDDCQQSADDPPTHDDVEDARPIQERG